jgi:hypothetical protein
MSANLDPPQPVAGAPLTGYDVLSSTPGEGDDEALSGRWRQNLDGSTNSGSTLGGTWGRQREPQIINPPRIGPRQEISSEIKRMGRDRTFLEGDVLEVEYAMAAGC